MVKSPKMIRVTAAIIESENKILIAQRKAKDNLFGGLWEFPGGKIEDGETPEECMARELKEELEIEVKVGNDVTTLPITLAYDPISKHAQISWMVHF